MLSSTIVHEIKVTLAAILAIVTVINVLNTEVMTTIGQLSNSATAKTKNYTKLTLNSLRSKTNPRKYPHPLLMDEDVATLIKKTSSSDYKWIGNHWFAPPGVPTFTPRQIKSYFEKRNVLIIGDSTSRRFYGTLFGLLNGTYLNDISVYELDSDDVIYEHKNKEENAQSCVKAQNRSIHEVPGTKWCVCKDWGSFKIKYDHMIQYCFETIGWFWSGSTEHHALIFQSQYDLVIIALGIWEVTKPLMCSTSSPNTTMATRSTAMLEMIHKNNPKDLQVVIRTSGFHEGYENNDIELRESNAAIRQFFHDLQNHNNMTLVDWGGVIDRRSFGEAKIKGDHPAHYGLEARLLMLQQLVHELLKSELIARDIV